MPRVLAVAWGMHEAPARGPKRELSHEAIVAAAIELADTGGLAGVTMAKVADALGFTTMSLYRYVASKDELIALMQDAVAQEPEVPPVDAQDWRRGLRDFAAMQRAVYADHPWVLEVPLSLTNVLMPNNIKFADAAYRAMRTLPAGTDVKQAVLLSLSMFVRVFGQLERDIGAAGPDAEIAPSALVALAEVITPERFPDLAPVLVSGGYTGDPPGEGDSLDDFELGLALLLEGVAAWTAAHPASEPPPGPGPGQAAGPLALAERELAAVTAQRKDAQSRVKELERRVKELERREREAQRERERAHKAQQG